MSIGCVSLMLETHAGALSFYKFLNYICTYTCDLFVFILGVSYNRSTIEIS